MNAFETQFDYYIFSAFDILQYWISRSTATPEAKLRSNETKNSILNEFPAKLHIRHENSWKSKQKKSFV